MINRDNETWKNDLREKGPFQEAALADLHALLIRALPSGISRWLSPSNPEFDAFIADVSQETLMRVLNNLHTFEGRSQFTTWVYKIAVRVALNELRRRKWKDVSLDGLQEQDSELGQSPRQFASKAASPEQSMDRKQAMQRVKQILHEELTSKQRAVMDAIALQGVPLEEVARRLGTNRNALYKMMHDARLKLKRRLEREGLPPQELLAMFANE